MASGNGVEVLSERSGGVYEVRGMKPSWLSDSNIAIDAQARREASERRRVKRKDQRTLDTVCFACREKGHAAKDCTKALKSLEGDGATKTKKNVAKSAVGICYR